MSFKDVTDEFDAFQDDSIQTVETGRSSINLKIQKKKSKQPITKTTSNKKIENAKPVEQVEVDEFLELSERLSEKYDTSGESISRYLISLKNKALSKKTFNGISTESLRDIITESTSDNIDWEHVIMQANPVYFVDITNKKLKELNTFDFVEELCPVEIDKSNFGLNNTLVNRIESVIINKNLSVIDDYTFMLYTKLRKVTIEKGSALNKLGIGAFSYCKSLKEFDISNCELLTYLPSKLLSGSEIKYLKLPESLDKIAIDAFEGSKIQSIEIAGYKYSTDEFIQSLEINEYKAFWKNFVYEF